MGLDTTHGCWHRSYSAFDAFRLAVAKACGIDLNRMEGFCNDGVPWASMPPDPIFALLDHSDCEGEIAVRDLIPLADRLDAIAVALPGGWGEAAAKFAAGCRSAAAGNEPVEFH